MISGSYRINPTPEKAQTNNEFGPFRAYCDQETAGGGWVVVLRRFDGFVNFNRKWNLYADGFGSMTGEFWFGLRKLWQLFGEVAVNIRFDFETENGTKTYAEYSGCTVEAHSSRYMLRVGQFIGKTLRNKIQLSRERTPSGIEKSVR